MSPEHNLIERNQELKKDLEAAIELIKRYEFMLTDLENQNSAKLKKTIHDLSNPLQVLSMSIEALQMKAPEDIQPALERMRRSAEAMTAIIINLRKLHAASVSLEKKATQVV